VTPAGVLVRARGVAKTFGSRRALAPLDLELRPGETIALVGPNGAGKSTLISLLARALAPSSGSVEWADTIHVGWVPQQPAHYGLLSARENLELFARLEGVTDAAGAAREQLERFELPTDGVASARLSAGNRQRLNVAIALLGRPDVLLLDEPTASLDPAQRRRLWETASGLSVAGAGVLFATQRLDEAEAHADRLLALRDGEVVPVEGLFE
jgi:ABC-type multidrug transport system ATPase subunit